MDFQAYATDELTSLAARLADAAAAERDAATAKLSATFDVTIGKLRDDHAQLAMENERLSAENAAIMWERRELLVAVQATGRGTLLERLASAFSAIAAARSVDAVLKAAA